MLVNRKPERPKEIRTVRANAPEEVDTLFFEAMNKGDLDSAVGLHEPDARWYLPTGDIVTGRSDIRAELRKFLELKPKFTANMAVFQSDGGDVAMSLSTWNLVGTDDEGHPVTMTAKKTVVLVRRQPDGSWLYVVVAPVEE